MLLPASTEALLKIVAANNLCIEFMFPYEYLTKEVDGEKLIIEIPKNCFGR